MAKTFLRSGNLDTVLALGENGQPVWASALQIRETLRLRRQTTLANCLAIPQANERGDRLDWYAPFPGKVKSWLGASDHERRQALELLTLNQQDLHALSLRARDAENPAMRLFAALLSKTLQFPDQQYVYLVDGKPVITFWGFVDPQARSRDDALACLRDTLEDELPPLLPEPPPAPLPAPLVVAPVIAPLIDVPPAAAEPVVEAEPEAVEPEPEIIAPEPEPQPAPEPVPAPRRTFALRPLALLLPVAAAVAAGVAFWLHSSSVPQAEPVAQVEPAAAPRTKPPVARVNAEKLAATLPQAPATVVAAAPAPVAPLEVVAEHTEPAKADDLVMTTEDARIGSVKFINGTWRVTLRQTNLPTGKPPSLRYQIRNGKGTATITQGDNIRCKADVTAAMTAAGSMEVRSRYTASCSDKSRYRMPELVCKAGDGIASCTAQYGADQVFPLTIKRESK